ncbi:uncharacterized protein EV420DRAFT_1272862, partial [Desarmillaria tabescens]
RAPRRTEAEKTRLAKEYLSSISLTPVDFLKTLITEGEFFSYQQGLYRASSRQIPELLDALWNHDQIHHRVVEWMEPVAAELVAKKVSVEFDHVKRRFFMYSNQVTPEFVTTWSFHEEMTDAHVHMPMWNAVLNAATQSSNAQVKNSRRDPTLVGFKIHILSRSFL